MLVEVAACKVQPGFEVVPEEGPTRRSCPQLAAGRTAVREAEESHDNSSVDGRCSASPAPFPSGTGLLVAVLPLVVVSSGAA